MSLEYYLYCRDKYEELLNKLDEIIEIYHDINEYKIIEDYSDIIPNELYEPEGNIFLYKNKRKQIVNLINMYDRMVKQLCNHEFENDMIDITPDRSENITYCKICGYTK